MKKRNKRKFEIKKIRNEKGVARDFLIVVIITVLSAAIIFAFLTKFQFERMSDKEVCRQSVILRSKEILTTEPGKLLVPLNCKTQYIKIKTTNEEEIKKEIATAMYDCWDMLGEGKYDFLGTGFLRETPVRRCIICSIISFDDKVKEKVKNIENFWDYLNENYIPNKNITYSQYFFGSAVKGENSLPTEKDYAVLYLEVKGLTNDQAAQQLIADLFEGAVVGFMVGGPKGMLVGIGVGLGVYGGLTIKQLLKGWIKDNCATGRCVSLILANYSAEDLGKKCEVLESIP